jgi:membrane-bound lytic murein transglycosylase B
MPFRRSLSWSRPSRKATTRLAIAGLVTLSAVPVGVLVTGQTTSRLAPVQTAYAAAFDASKQTASSVDDDATGSDGSALTAKLARDQKLRRTLLALRERSLATKPVGGSGLGTSPDGTVVVGGTVGDIPAIAVSAYRRAATKQAVIDPSCHVSWSLLAGIGRVESDHGRFGGSEPDANGVVHPAILGPVLDGSGGNAAIPDTDGGRYDNDVRWDRAVGPMQFIPSSWATGGRDGNGDGVRDPENLFDAALAAAGYLCASGGDLRTTSAAERAVLTYNHSWDYVLVVLGYAASYANQDLSAITAEVGKHLPGPAATASRKPVKRRPVPVPRTSPTKRVPAPTAGPTKVSPTPSRSVTPVPTTKPTPTRTPIPTATPTPTQTPTPTLTPTDLATSAAVAPSSAGVSAEPVPAGTQ